MTYRPVTDMKDMKVARVCKVCGVEFQGVRNQKYCADHSDSVKKRGKS